MPYQKDKQNETRFHRQCNKHRVCKVYNTNTNSQTFRQNITVSYLPQRD